MHLYALAIYEREGLNDFKKLACAQKATGFFATDDFKSIEDHTLRPYLSTAHQEKVVHQAYINNEYHYIQIKEKRIIAISSRTKLSIQEYCALFSNINAVYEGQKPGTSLNDIILNPLGYIRADNSRLQEVAELVNQAQKQLVVCIEKTQARGAQLTELESQSLVLEDTSKQFQKGATKLNSCCRL
jgi:hypothetical protein